MVKRMALGADACYSARGMMMALGCIQALKCNSNHCPVGVATQNRSLMQGLVPSDKYVRVANFHDETIDSLREIIGAMGIRHPSDLRPWHIMRRTSPTDIKHYGEISIERIREWDKTYIPKPCRASQDSHMLYKALMNSIGTEAKGKILIWEDEYRIGKRKSGNLPQFIP